MKVLRNFSHVALLFLGLLLIHGCSDNQMVPTEPVQGQDQATLAKGPPDSGSKLVFQSNRDGNVGE